AEFYPIDIRSSDLADNLADALYVAERPFINAHCVAKYLLSRAVRDSGVKVVMTGEGSDEILAGYPTFRRDMVLHNSDHLDPETAKTLLEQLSATNRVSQGLLLPEPSSGTLTSVQRNLGFVPTLCEVWGQIGGAMTSLLSEDVANHFKSRDSLGVL